MHDHIEPIDLGRNHPPMVADVFDREYLAAQQEVLAALPPSAIAGHHRWQGTERDRVGGATFTARRLGSAPDWRRVVVTNGTQSGLLMLFAGIVGRGGTLVTEDLTYPPLLTFARHFGFRIVGAPIDDQGLVPDALEAIVKAERPQALYAVPTHQNPTTSIMPLARRREIARIARAHGLAIIEDDIYSLLTPDGPPPLSALAPELSWYVLGTAKSIAAGMKIAYVVAPSVEGAAQRFWPGVRGTHWMATPMSAAIMTALIENGGAGRIIEAVGEEARARQVFSRQALGNIAVTTAREALHLWFPLPAGLPRAALAERARANGLVIGTSDQYVADGKKAPEAVRIGIGNPRTRAELGDALGRFTAAYDALRAPGDSP
jgi:DNA-binding transcriptional MocR family regulator